MTQLIPDIEREWSVLAEFDAGDVVDALSLGIIILDAQLCTVYANVRAQDALAIEVQEIQGRPLSMFLPQPQRFLDAVGQALERRESVYCDLAQCAGRVPGVAGSVRLRVAPLRDHVTWSHVLVEVGARQRIESEHIREP